MGSDEAVSSGVAGNRSHQFELGRFNLEAGAQVKLEIARRQLTGGVTKQ
jgi:hypothetical protein